MSTFACELSAGLLRSNRRIKIGYFQPRGKETNAGECYSGGGGGIRTRESLHPAGFQDRCLKPLGHPSLCLLTNKISGLSLSSGSLLCLLLLDFIRCATILCHL